MVVRPPPPTPRKRNPKNDDAANAADEESMDDAETTTEGKSNAADGNDNGDDILVVEQTQTRKSKESWHHFSQALFSSILPSLSSRGIFSALGPSQPLTSWNYLLLSIHSCRRHPYPI